MRASGARGCCIFGTVGAVAIAAHAGAPTAGHVMRSLEYTTIDKRFAVRGPPARPPTWRSSRSTTRRSTISQAPARQYAWPLWRCYYNDVVHRLSQAHPKAIAVDIDVHRAERRHGPQEARARTGRLHVPCDNLMIYAMADAGNVVVNTSQVDAKGQTTIFGGDVAEHFGIARRQRDRAAGSTTACVRHFFYRPRSS